MSSHFEENARSFEARRPAAPSAAQKALQKMGLRRDIDLALHLPLRYEDETRITPLASAREGRRCRSRPR